ncbi:rhamnogalacturonidase [Sphingomonas sp. Tas61C01]|uniref:rhamnogalacturonidase n=1 Tax=Sphingomonas sp. Tas61C01 TaxID=3458297 RepID=UPI00403E6568
MSRRRLVTGVAAALVVPGVAPGIGARAMAAPMPADRSGWHDVRRFGAKGDGVAIDSGAVNAAILHAASRGGGTVHLPAGVYRCYSIRLSSRITLHLDPGATILAASVPFEGMTTGGYDAAEPIDPSYRDYQDFGHSHWHNALIWGEGLHDVAIVGGGLIDGAGLARDWGDEPGVAGSRKPGVGDKAIALKNCRGVILRDVRIVRGGWFCLLATGVDRLLIDNVTVDTNRDGFDIDCCRDVRVVGCTVNSPYDDGICPKSSFALGYVRATEKVVIERCLVTGGYAVGSVIDGSWRRLPPTFNGTGRIKCGTESNGGFRDIVIRDCVFDQSRGLALETVDGGIIEDIRVTDIKMRGAQTSPIFLRLGRRLRGPPGTPVGGLRRVTIRNLISRDAAILPSTIAGVVGHPVEDIEIADVQLHQLGGQSQTLLHYFPAAAEDAYPEPGMFGALPATGLWARDVRNLVLRDIEVATTYADRRPALWFERAGGVTVTNLRSPAPAVGLRKVTDFRRKDADAARNVAIAAAEERML